MHNGFTVMSFLQRASRLFPDGKIIFGNASRTYAETYDRVIRASNACSSIGIAKGSVIGVADWNTPEFAEMLYVAGNLGAVIYPINIRLPSAQILQTVRQAGVQWFCISRDFESLAKGAAADSGMVISMDGIAQGVPYEKLVSGGSTDPPAAEVSGTDPYSILCTSGKSLDARCRKDITLNPLCIDVTVLNVIYQYQARGYPAAFWSLQYLRSPALILQL